MVGNARLFVNPPTFSPSPYGLLAVANDRTAGDGHWQAGVTWEESCPSGGGVTYDSCITSSPWASGAPAAKTDNVDRSWYGATPFTVFTEVDCAPVDFYERSGEIASSALNKVESWQVERAFWTGAAGGVQNAVYPHLAANQAVTDGMVTLQMAATVVTGVALNIVDALGSLEGALANCYNGVGVIHIQQALVPVLAGLGLLVRDGSRYRTHNGNLVAIGAGYPGTGPTGAAPTAVTNSWMYATGSVFYYRGPVTLRTANNAHVVRSVNTIKAIAERTYVVGYDCCLAAVLVSTVNVIATSTTTP